MKRLVAAILMLPLLPVFASAQVRQLPLSHQTGADAARVAGPYLNQSFSGRGFNRFGNFDHDRRFDRGRDRRFQGRRNNVVLVPSYGYPYFGDGFLDNGYESASADQAQSQAPAPQVVVVPQAASPDVTELRREINRLSEQLNSMHSRPAPAEEAQARVPDQPPTLLVYRDQHVEQIYNYAIVGQNLWALDSGTGTMGRKIPLVDLNLPETAHVNAEHGIRFSAPSASVR